MFHIGVPGVSRKKNKNEKRKRNILTIKYDLKCGSKRIFIPYVGTRWQIPPGIPVSPSIRYKFSQFERSPMTSVINEINIYIKRPTSFININYNISTWKPPKQIVSAIQSYRDLQINEYKKVKCIYLKIFKFIRMFKKLIYVWRIRNCMRNVKNSVDPVTLDVPLKPVYIIDFKQKLSYVYEASSLRKTIENKILFSDYMFPDPKEPINVWSNQPFTYGQLISIISQCKKYGEFSWVLDRFKTYNCNLKLFEKVFKQQLKLEAINSHFKDSKDTKESVIDFFESQASISSLTDNMINSFTTLYNRQTTLRGVHSYIKKWIVLTKRYYIATELKDSSELFNVKIESNRLLDLAISIF